MQSVIDLEAYPIDQSNDSGYRTMVDHCREELKQSGMFNLHGFLRPEACIDAVREIEPIMSTASFTHRRLHNIYFLDEVAEIHPDHPALEKVETINHTVCADQLKGSSVVELYEYPPLLRFLADTMSKPDLYPMEDALARVNVMSYREGEALNWHFDRSEFTITLLLQAPLAGGEFQFRHGLRNEHDPNYDGVALLLSGGDDKVQTLGLEPGTLSVFQGKNTAHRVTPVVGSTERMIAVFSFYEFPGKMFSEQERVGFYGRAS